MFHIFFETLKKLYSIFYFRYCSHRESVANFGKMLNNSPSWTNGQIQHLHDPSNGKKGSKKRTRKKRPYSGLLTQQMIEARETERRRINEVKTIFNREKQCCRGSTLWCLDEEVCITHFASTHNSYRSFNKRVVFMFGRGKGGKGFRKGVGYEKRPYYAFTAWYVNAKLIWKANESKSWKSNFCVIW